MASVIKAENISKQYRLGEIGTGSLSHDMNRFWYKIRGKEDPYLKIGEKNDRTSKGESKYVWSLQNIGFEIEQGDAVGIVGRNGAGKSTLLKILSRVTAPTTGTMKIKGRIASLLEVGTGFHPDLSGRDNIFLNGAILGMRKNEIKRKFDEIVEFAGVERYIDTPVKRYSSGMYVRLAFAVAAHLESEILIVDEVLAVGDAEFQKKCLGKMSEVSKGEGRTVLFVSHQMGSISQLCTKAMLLKFGQIEMLGKTESVLDKYIENNIQLGKYTAAPQKIKDKRNLVKEFYTTDEFIDEKNDFKFNEHIYAHIKFEINDFVSGLQIGLALDGKHGNKVFTVLRDIERQLGNDYYYILKLPKELFAPNKYTWTVAIWTKDGQYFDVLDGLSAIQIHDSGSSLAFYEGNEYGNIILQPNWER